MLPAKQTIQVEAQFPEKLQCLFQPKRYKVLYGGRGAGRSWGVARFLLIESSKRQVRNLCAREFQNSIKDSVHKLLADQITELKMNYLYDVQQASIRCLTTGSEFGFEGIRHNIGKIKSYEGIDYCWVEEAQSVTRSSWDVLIPTIRKPGSEIIITFNPELEGDETYQRFVINPPANAVVVMMTWRDNPWFPQVLRDEMEDLKRRDYDAYLHVWEGNCKQLLEGAVYADELREAITQNRITSVPYDRAFGVTAVFDLGRRDCTSIWFVQRAGWEHHFIDFYQNNLKFIDHYLGIMQNRGYLFDEIWLPHDAKAKTLGTKMSIEEQVREKFPGLTRIVPKLSIADGLNAARTVFPNAWFDKVKCSDGIHALKHYSYEVDERTGLFSLNPLHNEHSHAADAFRYYGVASKQPGKKHKLDLGKLPRLLGGAFDDFWSTGQESSTGWMGR